MTKKLLTSLSLLIAVLLSGAVNAQECENYKLYYTHNPEGTSAYSLLEVELNELGEATYTELLSDLGSSHIALSPDGGSIYMLGSSLRIYDVATGVLSEEIEITTADGAVLSGFPSAVCDADGVLYGGHSGTDQVYTIDLEGNAVPFGPSVNVDGGDLIFVDGDLWSIERGANRFTKVLTGDQFIVGVDEINGAAVLANGNVLVADGDGGSLLKEVNLGSLEVVAEYDIDLPLYNGDLAGGCLDQEGGEGCDDFSIFYASHGPGISGTNIYNVEISGDEAVLNLENNISYEAHIGYISESQIVLLVNANGNFVEFYDPNLGTIEGQVSLEDGLSQLYAVVYNPNDELLYVGSDNQNSIYAVNLADGSYEFVAEAPIHGGDLILIDGELYVATREGDELRKVVGASTEFVGSIPEDVNGAAASAENNLLVANFGSAVLTEVDTEANTVAEYTWILDGEPFTAKNGDMASGCNDDDNEEVCLDYRVYLINNPEEGGATLYNVNIEGGSASLEVELELEHGAHIALADNGDIYLVAAVQGRFQVYDPETNMIGEPIQITYNGEPVNGTPQAVVDPASGNLVVASVVDNAVYSVNPENGQAALIAEIEVSGGDLVYTLDGDLWITNRFNDEFFNLTDGVSSFIPGLNNINGAAILEDGTIIVSNSGSSELNLIDPATGMLMEDAFEIDLVLADGDMASGCIEFGLVEEECDDFRYFYMADNTPGIPQGTIYEGQITEGEFQLNLLFSTNLVAHLAVNTENGIFYAVNGSVLRSYSYSGVLINEVSTSEIGGITAAVWNSVDGLVYVGDGSDNEIWTVDPVTGDLALFADDVPVQGGDLFLSQEGGLYLIERVNNGPSKLYEIVDGEAVEIADVATAANGGAATADNGLIVAEGNNSNSFFVYNLEGGDEMELTATSGGELFPVVDGDMASGCFDDTEFFEPEQPDELVAENAPAVLETYPNPTTGTSNINFEVRNDGYTTIELVDLSGRPFDVVFSQMAFEGQKYSLQFNANDLPDGIYLYKLTTPEGVIVEKLMINRN